MLAKAYKIETKRLILRCYQPKDAVLLKSTLDASIDHLRPWLSWIKPEPEPLETTIKRIRKWRGQFDLGEDYTFGIFNKEEDILIGSAGLHTQLGIRGRKIGYWLHANHLRKGYAFEAAKGLTKVGFEIEHLQRIEIHCSPENVRSENIPKKLGYLTEGQLANRRTNAYGVKRNIFVWTMFRHEYAEKPIKSVEIKAFNILGNPIETTE